MTDDVKIAITVGLCACAVIWSIGLCILINNGSDCPEGTMMYLGKCVAAEPIK